MALFRRARYASARLLSVSTTLALLAYIVVQSAAPILDHDLVCHLKSRTHCTVCATGASAPGLTGAVVPPPVPDLSRIGTIELYGEHMMAAATFGASQNRAPPV